VKLTVRQKETLALLYPDRWVRPMEIGGGDGTYHSKVLRQLVRKGVVESKENPRSLMAIFHSPKAGRMYRLTAAGQEYAQPPTCPVCGEKPSGSNWMCHAPDVTSKRC